MQNYTNPTDINDINLTHKQILGYIYELRLSLESKEQYEKDGVFFIELRDYIFSKNTFRTKK